MSLRFRCAGCGVELEGTAGDWLPFRCDAARRDAGVDHVMVRVEDEAGETPRRSSSRNPFVRYRFQMTAFRLARELGKSERWFSRLVRDFDAQVAAVDGRGFEETPFTQHPALGARLALEPGGEVWVKDETGNVSGSHKARHLAGVMLALRVMEEARGRRREDRPPLAIASCGNAALAAAVIARACDWPLQVFVPRSASAVVLDRLASLGAQVTICDRTAGVPGDPCYHAFQAALEHGAIPFCCQGSDNGLTIEGGETLSWEMIDARPGGGLDAVFVQVGGGALASAVAQGFRRALSRGGLGRLPRLYAVQTRGGHPLVRAYERVFARLDASRWPSAIEAAMDYARHHRGEFMWPWEQEPRSIAHGILDDETYDWAAVVEAMLLSGGAPVVVTEDMLRHANEVAREATGIRADHTGTSGLAGLMTAFDRVPALRHERVAVLFTGADREN